MTDARDNRKSKDLAPDYWRCVKCDAVNYCSNSVCRSCRGRRRDWQCDECRTAEQQTGNIHTGKANG